MYNCICKEHLDEGKLVDNQSIIAASDAGATQTNIGSFGVVIPISAEVILETQSWYNRFS
jgi:superfamily I DNA/RNA helicase